jgi:undecaprenyl-phosphate 4-deoxy-4-formamido-L-arabinose transferase
MSKHPSTTPHRAQREPANHERTRQHELDVTAVVPVYRSAATLQTLVERIAGTLRARNKPFEILLVEDCGGDGSWGEIMRLASEYPEINGLQLSRNFGQHAATICGAAYSRGRWVATIDDDLEQAPEDLTALIEKAEEGFTLVYGVYPTRSHATWRNMTSAIARRLFRLAIPSLNFDYTSLRVIDGSLARSLADFDSPYPFVDGYLSWLTNQYAMVTVNHGERVSGHSNYTIAKLLKHTLNIFVTFSDLPLRIASWLGIAASLGGAAWLLAILVSKVVGGITVSGFTSIMAAITLFGGIQLLILGILGEYIGRINFKSSRKPLFVIARNTKWPAS